MTVGVVTVAHGERYRAFLPEWATAIGSLRRKPDAVTIVTDTLNCQHLTRALDILHPDTVVIQTRTRWKKNTQILANEAIEYTRTDWICKLDADDLIYPHALNSIDDWPTDVCMFGISENGFRNLIPSPVTAQQVLASPHNLIFAGSPFRRDLWEQTPGFQDVTYDDWAFWRSCARAGATFHPTNTIDYYYRLHAHNYSSRADHPTATEEVFRLGRARE